MDYNFLVLWSYIYLCYTLPEFGTFLPTLPCIFIHRDEIKTFKACCFVKLILLKGSICVTFNKIEYYIISQQKHCVMKEILRSKFMQVSLICKFNKYHVLYSPRLLQNRSYAINLLDLIISKIVTTTFYTGSCSSEY